MCQILQYYNLLLLINNHNVHYKFSFKNCVTILFLKSTCFWGLFLKCHVFVFRKNMINNPLRKPVADVGEESVAPPD